MKSLQWPLSLHWRRGNNIQTDRLLEASSVIISGMVYCRGYYSGDGVVQYNPVSGEWSELPSPPVNDFTMTSFNDQLVLAGGRGDDTRITVWDSGHSKWVHPYPPMPTGRSDSAALGYQNYLIVACGYPYKDVVEVLDSSSGRWYNAQSVPLGGCLMSSVVVGDCWYLSSIGRWKDRKEHIFSAHLPTLISSATSAHISTASIWLELPTPPVKQPTLLALQGHLLLVGGGSFDHEIHRYDPETRQWRECGQLPVGMYAPCCVVLPSGDLMVVLPSGDLMVAGRVTKAQKMWIGNINS